MTTTRAGLEIATGTGLVEVFSLRRGMFSSALPDGGIRLVAWPHAGTLAPAAGNRPVLKALARTALSVRQLARVTGGEEARIAGIVEDLRRSGWLKVTLATDGRPLYTVDPLAPPPDSPDVLEDSGELSGFTVLRRDREDLLVESPRAWCEIRLHAPELAAVVSGAPGTTGVAVRLRTDLARGGFLTSPGGEEDTELRFRQWGPHEMLFHDRSRLRNRGYFGDNFGGTFWARGEFDPLPARPEGFGGPVTMLPVPDLAERGRTDPTLTDVLENRRSLRHYDDEHPIRLDQLGEFLYRCGRTRLVRERDGVEYASRPYPSGGSVYELEMYLLVRHAEGLEPGLYHYRSDEHALERVTGPDGRAVRKLYTTAGHGSAEGVPPQVMVIISARFGRLMWKYTSMGYALILKHVGVLYQTMYCVATAMGLAPCGLGSGDSVAFAEATGRDRFTESSVGEFLIGSRAKETQ
jgi:SagB-type dehydrogenase family enzyme